MSPYVCSARFRRHLIEALSVPSSRTFCADVSFSGSPTWVALATGLLSTRNVANVTKELFGFIVNSNFSVHSHVWPVITGLDHTGVLPIPLQRRS